MPRRSILTATIIYWNADQLDARSGNASVPALRSLNPFSGTSRHSDRNTSS